MRSRGTLTVAPFRAAPRRGFGPGRPKQAAAMHRVYMVRLALRCGLHVCTLRACMVAVGYATLSSMRTTAMHV